MEQCHLLVDDEQDQVTDEDKVEVEVEVADLMDELLWYLLILLQDQVQSLLLVVQVVQVVLAQQMVQDEEVEVADLDDYFTLYIIQEHLGQQHLQEEHLEREVGQG